MTPGIYLPTPFYIRINIICFLFNCQVASNYSHKKIFSSILFNGKIRRHSLSSRLLTLINFSTLMQGVGRRLLSVKITMRCKHRKDRREFFRCEISQSMLKLSQDSTISNINIQFSSSICTYKFGE